jgi:hypothetical protein
LISVYRALGGGWELRYQKEGIDPAAAGAEAASCAQVPATPVPELLSAPKTDPARK